MKNDDDISVLLSGDNIMSASIDEVAEHYMHRIEFLEMLLYNVEEQQAKFWEYVHDPFIDLEVFYDSDTDDYILSVMPVEGLAYQRALNERLGIPSTYKNKK